MTTLSYNNQLEEVFEFSHIVEDLKKSRKYVKKQLGEVGVSVTMPFVIGIGTIKLKKSKRHISKAFDTLFDRFNQYSERDQMKFERDLIKSFEELKNNIVPLMPIIEGSKKLGSQSFVNEVEDLLLVAETRIKEFTKVVYPERIDPASNKELFSELVKAYQDVDLSDWREEDRKKS